MQLTQADVEYQMEKMRRMFGFGDPDEQTNLHDLHSRYWMSQLPTENKDLITLASYRRAVAKFVQIATRRYDIDVRFSSGNQSYTVNPERRKCVVISAKIKNKEFDAVVGLALHEAYHIKESDFSIIDWIGHSSLTDEIREQHNITRERYPLHNRIEELAKEKNVDMIIVYKWLGEILNFVEDRRIDNISWIENPGYQEYYRALYRKYFGDKIISLGLKSSSHRELNYGSYDFRITNMVNPDSDPTALPELDVIFDAIDLENIDRLVNTSDAANVATDVLETILRNIDPIEIDEQQNPDEKDDDEEDENEEPKETDEEGDENLDQNEEEDDDEEEDDEEEDELPNLDQHEVDELEEVISNQKKLIQNIIEKEDLSEADQNRLDAIDKAGTTIEHVAGDHETGTDVIVIRKLTMEILKTIEGLRTYGIHSGQTHPSSRKGVENGIKLGRLLQSRLQVRNEDKHYHSKRKTAGHIDRRMLYNIGVGNTSIFETVKIVKFGDAIVHVSIDASGSMDGKEWQESITAVVALAFATTKIKNLDIVISFRTTGELNDNLVPVMVIGYDSRVDDFSKIRNLFPYLEPNGMTPEGLCYLATMKDILESVKGKTGYLINFSDGYPNMSHRGKSAVQLTKEAVDEMRRNGIQILSFFVGHGEWDKFRQMYSKDAKKISVTDIVPLAREINKMLSTIKG